jgi:peptidoglycan/xylan/chitin deacetylase (PgdA/CDA1 family)
MSNTGTARKIAVALAALVALIGGGLVARRAAEPRGEPARPADLERSIADRTTSPAPDNAQPMPRIDVAGAATAQPASANGQELDGTADGSRDDGGDARGWRELGAPALTSARSGLNRGFSRHRMLHFTFDDGPDVENTPHLLDLLAEHRVQATFFVVGKQLTGPRSLERRALIQRMEDEGHTVAVHTFNHPDLTRLSAQAIEEDLGRVETSLEATLGYRPGLFRPPYGRRNAQSLGVLRGRGYTQVLWNIAPEDGARSTADVVRAFRNALDRMEGHPRGPGGIVIMHDPHSTSVEAIPEIMAELQARNCALLARDGEELWDVTEDLRPFLMYEDEVPAPVIEQRQREIRSAAHERCASATP